jgi:DNA-directed RNA polymerase specialized sigma24 family protein
MDKLDTTLEIIIRLRKQQKREDDCLLEALKSIPEKYSKIVLLKYVELCCGGLPNNKSISF